MMRVSQRPCDHTVIITRPAQMAIKEQIVHVQGASGAGRPSELNEFKRPLR